jgi:hypothetical protein
LNEFLLFKRLKTSNKWVHSRISSATFLWTNGTRKEVQNQIKKTESLWKEKWITRRSCRQWFWRCIYITTATTIEVCTFVWREAKYFCCSFCHHNMLFCSS